MMPGPVPIKLLFILDDFPDPNAGTEGQFWLLLRGLDRAHVTPAIVLLRQSAFLEREAADVPIRVLNVQRLRSPRSLWRIVGAVWWAWRAGFRVAHIFYNDSAMVFPPLLKLAGINVVVSRRDLGFWHTRGNLRVLRFAARFVDRVVANCEAVRRVVIDSEGFRPERVEVIYNGTGRDFNTAPTVTRQSFGIPDGVPLMVLVANLRPLKRVSDAIRGVAAVGERSGRTPHLLIVGEDREGVGGVSHRMELEDLGRELGLTEYLHFSGKMSNPVSAIALADVCLLCSESEGLANAVIEYMLAGKPVVCTAVGGNPELVLDGQTGRLIPVGDIDALAAAIDEVLSDTERARRWGQLGRERVAGLFSGRVMIRRHEDMYDTLLDASVGRP